MFCSSLLTNTHISLSFKPHPRTIGIGSEVYICGLLLIRGSLVWKHDIKSASCQERIALTERKIDPVRDGNVNIKKKTKTNAFCFHIFGIHLSKTSVCIVDVEPSEKYTFK